MAAVEGTSGAASESEPLHHRAYAAKPQPSAQVNVAPIRQQSVSTAVSIDGVPVPVAR